MYITEHWQAYQTAIRQASRPYDMITGTITFTDSTTMIIDKTVLPSNAIEINKKCTDGDELMFGGVFLSTLKLSVITNKSRYSFFDAIIELFYKIKIAEDTFEEVPLGIYKVADAERPHDVVNLTAYDSMTLLDIPLGGVYLEGTPWQILSEVAYRTGYQLSFTETDLEAFPNYTYTLSATEGRGLKTYRDVVKEVCQHLGCFALDDRTGKLALKQFSATPDTSLTISDWYSMTPADYTCHYRAISVTGLMGTFNAISENPAEVGNVMVIKDSPAWDLGTNEALQAKVDNLFTHLTAIDDYTPTVTEMPSDPTFDCGDRVELTTRDGTVMETLLTEVEWKFHEGMKLTSDGKNPYFDTTEIIEDGSERITQQNIEGSKLQFVSFSNLKKHVIGDEDTVEIGRAVFTPTTDTSALFVATILVDVDVADVEVTTSEDVEVPVTAYDSSMQPTTVTDINGNPVSLSGTATNTYTYARDGKVKASIYYTMNDVRVPNDANPYVAIEEIEQGRHIITVSYPITGLIAYQRITWRVYMKCEGGTITIPIHTLEGTIVGQEITSITPFNGELEVSEDIKRFAIGKLGELKYNDVASVAFIQVQSYNVSEYIEQVNNAHLGVYSAKEDASIFFVHEFTFCAENGDRIVTEGEDRILTE